MILDHAFPLFENIKDFHLSGNFRNTLGLVLKNLGIAQGNTDYMERALIEFTAAGFFFEQTKNLTYLSSVENNIGFLLSLLGKHADAYTHLDRAKELALSVGDNVRAAHFDETRARVLFAQGKLTEARQTIERVITELKRLDARALLPEAQDTRSQIIARSSNVVPFAPPLTNLADKFIITVSDDSLIYAGIEAGDKVWMCRASEAQDGDLIFACTPDCMTLAFTSRTARMLGRATPTMNVMKEFTPHPLYASAASS